MQPTTIQSIQDAVAPAFALLAGMQLDLFAPMADGELTAEELAARLGVDANRLARLLYALAAAGLLTEREGSFRNGPEAAEFLVSGPPRYMGGAHEILASIWSANLHTASPSGPADRPPNTTGRRLTQRSTRPPSEAWRPWLWPSAELWGIGSTSLGLARS